MKVFCKRTYIEDHIKFIKGKYYSIKLPEKHESDLGVYYHIQSENNLWNFIKKKDFIKYFIDINELRNSKIDEILNDKLH